MYKNGPNDIYCFICGQKYRLEKIKSHINLCKNIYETKNHINIIIPFEYELLFDDLWNKYK